MDHFCILFLREKDGGQCPLPNRVAAQWVTWSRETRRCCRQNSRARFADRRFAGGESPQPDCAVVPLATKSRVPRQCRKQNPERVLLPARAHLPVEDTALAGSARYQIALWHNG